MRTAINLSSRPFTNHRLLWIAIVAVFVASLWTTTWAAAEKSRLDVEAEQLQKKINEQREAAERAKEEEDRREREQKVQVISEDDTYQLAAARQLLQLKSLSWSRILSDLENYVPNNTRVTAIKLQEVSETGKSLSAQIEVKALGQTAAEMTSMMGLLEKSNGLFQVGEVSQQTVNENGEIPFTLNLSYRPDRGQAQ
jgi:Tfp pilus assembly protein PilN